MTFVIEPTVAESLRRAAVRATLAPSVHNTQPWQFVLADNALEIHADWRRWLRVIDPRGRQLMISCGCALFNARVSIAATGYQPHVTRFPDPTQPDLVARLTLATARTDSPVPLAELDSAIETRHTNRLRFAGGDLPSELVDTLIGASLAEDAELMAITEPDHRLATARLSQQAELIEDADPAYRAELRAWTTADPRRLDGVSETAVPHMQAGAREEDLPLRDFERDGMGWLPVQTHSSLDQGLLLIGTIHDSPTAWLRTGEALERVWLEITRRGYVSSPMTQVVEVAATNAQLRQQLHLTMHPHVLLRVGHAPPTPPARRRRLADMLHTAD